MDRGRIQGMIINMEVEDISTSYVHSHISLKTGCSDLSYIGHLKITRVLHRNIEIVLKLEDLIRKRYILHIRVYDGSCVEMNDMINLYKCIYYKERYLRIIEKLNEKKETFELTKEENQIRNDLIDNYEIMSTTIEEIFNRYHLHQESIDYTLSSSGNDTMEYEYTNY